MNAEPTLACGALTNAEEVRGKIVLVRLGECYETVKMQNAVNAGAAGVIFIDDIPCLFSITSSIIASTTVRIAMMCASM